ncbi:trimethylamine methyltransferase family protein [Sporomusa sp. KB1]|uniref:trimethylamine methyltransferase family protein n=1 Tax=Sporomusa sp. KB1 TaxID=943346 RepID=UPI0011ACBEBC|nr:trimethylamine methyltransferase family protein [Sporomusa sp. KB1]TWH47243.1 trimethylamine--corrinoid protein Co-methyltransferase [Sporomusa sp. KB1]
MNTTKSHYTRANYAVNQTTVWEMLSEDQCEELFMTALEVLERTGSEIQNEEARGIFEKAGCWVDGNRVRIPSALSEWAVRSAPSRVTVCDRNGKRALNLETTNAYYGPGQGNVYVLDPMTGERRKPVKGDVVKTAMVCDGLQNIDFVMNNGLPTDVKESTAEVHAFEALVTNTSKPIIQAIPGVKQAQAILDIATAVAGSLKEFQKNPFAVFQIETEGTLVHSDETLAKVMFAAQNRVPYIYATKLIAGETSPATPAGAIVVALADVLVGIVLGQLVRQGAPVIAGGFFTIKNQETGILSYGAPEISLMGTGMANVLRFLRIPSFGFAGATDAKVSDAQMGLEAAFSILHAGMSGTSLIYGCGQLEYGQTGSVELLVMGDEVMGMTRRMMKGVEVNEERMARGVIDAVQPGGHYLGEEHTLTYFRTETWWPTVMNRARIADWEANGSKSLGQRVKEKTQSIINTHQSGKLSAEVLSKIKAILDKADGR